MVARIILFIYACLIACPVRYQPMAAGTDSSWAFALNYAHDRALLFGKDAGFTYGPLAYLIMPMPIGRNLAEGICFQLAMWAMFAAVLAWIAFRQKPSLALLTLFAGGLVLGADSFRVFGYAGGDTFLVFLGLLLLGGYGALAVGALLFFVKFSSAISIMSAAGLYAAALFLRDRRQAWRAVLGLALWPLAVGVLACFVLEPTPAAWWRYVRLGLDMSSGYSVTMSEFGSPAAAIAALLVLLAWAAAVAVLCWRQAASCPLAFACLGPLFLEFKHSFVREAGHTEIFLLFVPLVWAVVALATEFPRKDRWYLAAALALPAIAWYPQGRAVVARLWHPAAALQSLRPLREIAPYAGFRQRLENVSAQALDPDRLPPELLARIAGAAIAPFPTECGYVAANRIDMRLFPVFQMYQAYTPFLDGLNADFLRDPQRAPRFILFDWDAIDQRHPLLDVPATALEMYRHYDFDGMYGAHMLLRRRGAARFGSWRKVETRELRLDQPLRIPPSDHPLAARIHLRWNASGQLLKFFFRVPELRLIRSSASAPPLNARVPPEVMEDLVPIDFLPSDLEQARALFAGDPLAARADTMTIAGPAVRYLQPVARVEIEEAADVRLSFAAPLADHGNLRHLGSLDSWRIEMMNDTGAAGLGEVIVPDNRGYLRVEGWAVANNEAAGGVWMELDGKLHPARYGLPRRDIAALLHRTDDLACGFEWTVAGWELGRTWHELAVRIVAREGSGYYDGGRRLRFRME